MKPSDADVMNIIATPTIGPTTATVPLTSPAIASVLSSWPRTSWPLRFRPDVPPALLEHDRLQRHGLADEVDDGDRDPDHGDDQEARDEDDP